MNRWTEVDPLGLIDGANFYKYVDNDPVRQFDIMGTQTVVIGGSVCVGMAALLAALGIEVVYHPLGQLIQRIYDSVRDRCKKVCPPPKNPWRCKAPEYHNDHYHYSKILGRKCHHWQLNCWKVGVKGSEFVWRIPNPLRCVEM